MKNAKTIAEQIELLKSRNLIFENESRAERLLLQHNYYRLSGYWRKYQIDLGLNPLGASVEYRRFQKIRKFVGKSAMENNFYFNAFGG